MLGMSTPFILAGYLVLRGKWRALAFPAVVVVWRTMVQQLADSNYRWGAGTVLAAAAMVAWLVGVVCLGWHVMRWYGIHLAVLAILGAAVVWAWSRIAADNRGADPDAHRDSGATI